MQLLWYQWADYAVANPSRQINVTLQTGCAAEAHKANRKVEAPQTNNC